MAADEEETVEGDGDRNSRELLHKDLTSEIIGAAFEVHRVLGHGFLEGVYKLALQAELCRRGITAEVEHPIDVYYKNIIVGFYKADLLVANAVIVELKIAKTYCAADEAQLLNELKATGVRVGLLINFGQRKVEFKRLVL
ncbi:MAG TPA: GxxExxY protein [Planctomycetaceae bacterium]|nr:GxxExxY protein [Planctomycetaceae bacterium]